MRGKTWENMIDVDYPNPGEITDEAVKENKKHSVRFKGSVRASTGRIISTREYEQRKERAMRRPLP